MDPLCNKLSVCLITGGGEIKVVHQKLEWKVASKVGSLDNVKHRPGGGQVQIFDEKYCAASRGSSRSSSTVRGTNPACNPATTNTADQPTNTADQPTNNSKPVPESRIRDVNNKGNDARPHPLPLPNPTPASLPSSASSSSSTPQSMTGGKNVRSTSATRRTSPPGSSNSNDGVRKQVLQQNFSANKNTTNDSSSITKTASSAPPTSASSNSSTTDQSVAANHGSQNENPNSNPKPPIVAPKPSHNLKFWKKK